MNRPVVSLLAETSVHIKPSGSASNKRSDGEQCGHCSKTAREDKTFLPVLTKSELQETFRDRDLEKIGAKFDIGRLLLLPVRSLDNISSWVTCPELLHRFFDLIESPNAKEWLDTIPESSWTHGQALSNTGPERFFLEGFNFLNFGGVPTDILNILGSLISDEITRTRLLSKVVVLGNDDFELLVNAGGIPIHVRGQFNDSKIRKALRFDETLPPDSLFYCTMPKNTSAAVKKTLKTALDQDPFLQIGSQETTGRGWFQAVFCEIES